MKIALLKIVIFLALACPWPAGVVRAQDAVPPPPDQKQPGRPQQAGQPHRPGPLRGAMMPGMYPRGDREHLDAFKQLPEEERNRVRAAFEKAWIKLEVMQARERLMKANEDYREALQHALKEADPGVVKILEKVKAPMPGGGFHSAGRMPDPNDPEFSKKAVEGFGVGLQNWAQAEKRDIPVKRVHERVMEAPAVRDLLKQLEVAAEPQRRMEAFYRLREAYQAAVRTEIGPPRDGPQHRDGPPKGPPERRDNPPPPDGGKKP